MAGELNDAIQEEIPMEEHRPGEPLDDNSATDADGSPALGELEAAPEPTHILHDTPEDLMSDKSVHLEGHNREHADKAEVDPRVSNADGTSQADCAPTDETRDT